MKGRDNLCLPLLTQIIHAALAPEASKASLPRLLLF